MIACFIQLFLAVTSALPFGHSGESVTINEKSVHGLSFPVLGAVLNSSSKLNIAILVVGTRGDLDPFISIAKRLQQDGHRVRICTHMTYNNTVLKSNIEYYPIQGDPRKLSEFMVNTKGTLVPNMGTVKTVITRESQKMSQMVRDIIMSTWPAVTNPDRISGDEFIADAVIANPPVMVHVHIAEKLRIPVHIVFPQPWVPTAFIAHPLSGTTYSDYGRKNSWNLFSYKLVDRILDIGMSGMIMEFRHDLGLPTISNSAYHAFLKTLPHTFIYSSHLLPKPEDWESHVNVVGAVQDPNRNAPEKGFEDLIAFLSAGAPPIYVGFGSMILTNAASVRNKFLNASKRANVRIIVQSGWSDLYDPSLEKCTNTSNYCFIGPAPHNWLFDHVSAVVHHGGAGTTAAGLFAGKPTMIVPFFGDQYLWGMAAYKKGVGVYPKPLSELSIYKISRSFEQLLSQKMQNAASEMSRVMKAEESVESVVKLFYRYLAPVIPASKE